MRDLIVSEWVTLDGVYDADTMPQWFEPFDSKERQTYIRDTVHSADAMLLGRVTYEMFAAHWPNQKNNEFGIADRLNNMPKLVVSSSLETAEWANSTIIKGNVEAEVEKLKHQPGRRIVVYGSGTLVEALLRAGLVDELRFLVQPIVAGSGKRFFKEGMSADGLELSQSKQIDNGVMILQYRTATGSTKGEGEGALEEAATNVAAASR